MFVVTGATGHVGNTLVKKMVSQNKKVRALIHDPSHTKPLEGVECEKVNGDILDYSSLVKAFTGADVVFHCAALISIVPGIFETLKKVNVEGTENVIKACRECKIRRLVYISSIEAIGDVRPGEAVCEADGFNPDKAMIEYGITKAHASMKVMEAVKAGLDAVLVSPVGIVGPYDFKPSQMGTMVRDFVFKKLPGYPAGGGFNFVDVRDVADIILLAAEKGRTGENYLAAGEQLTIPQMMDMLEEVSGIKKPFLKIPFWTMYLAAFFAETNYKIFGGTPLFTRGSTNILKSNLQVNGEKARKEFNFTPTPLRKTFADSIEWFKANDKFVSK